VQTWRPLARIP